MIGTIPTIRELYVPKGHRNRPGIKLNATTITIHNTANKKSTAKNERDFVCSPNNTRTASFHWVVDQHEAIAVIPMNEVAWHAGDGNGPGNRASIGIEVCESGDQAIVWKNAVGLAAKTLHERGWGVDRIRKHQDWSGKYCPRMIIPVWSKFISDVQETLNFLNKPVIKVEEWMKEPIKYLHDKGIITDYNEWAGKAATEIPVWAATTMIANTYKLLANDNSKSTAADWKQQGIDTLYNAKIIADKNLWSLKANEIMPVWGVTTMIASMMKILFPKIEMKSTNDWKADGIIYLNKAGVLEDEKGWSSKVDQPMPVWAVCSILKNAIDK